MCFFSNKKGAVLICAFLLQKCEASSAVSGKIGSNSGRSGFHGLVTFIPVGRTYLVSMSLDKLKGIYHPQCFRNVAAEGEVIYYRMSHKSLGVDEKEAAQGNSIVEQDAIALGDVLVQVGNQRILDVADSAILQLGVFPSQMGEFRINGNADHFTV